MYTTHGHHILGGDSKSDATRCGGIKFCSRCKRESESVMGKQPEWAAGEVQNDHELLKYFTFKHLPLKLAHVSEPFCKLATQMATLLPDGSQKDVALQKLLEAKDAAVRAALEN